MGWAAALMAALFLFGCGDNSGTSATSANTNTTTTLPEPTFALPSADQGCDEVTNDGAASTVPITVDRPDNLVNALVNVCFGDKGPYPLQVDTGASSTVISTSLAKEVGLKPVGKPQVSLGTACKIKTQGYQLPAWSLAGIPLEGMTVTAANLKESGEGYSRGQLGADVLSRFGAVRIDYDGQTMTVPGKEGPVFSGSEPASSLPGTLVKDGPELTIPMEVEALAGVIQTVKVAFGDMKPTAWTVDTGADLSVADSKLVKEAGLEPNGTAQEGTAICANIVTPEYDSGDWKMAGNPLAPQPIASTPLSKNLEAGGLVGSDLLASYGSVVFDWGGGQLLLGAG